MTAVGERIETVFRDAAGHPAVLYEGEWYTWSDLRELSAAIDGLLDEHRVPPGTAVGLVLRERPTGVAALLALLSTNRCAVLVTPIQPDAPMCDDVKGLKLAALIADEQDWEHDGFIAAASEAQTFGVALPRDRSGSVRPVPELLTAGADDRFAVAADVAITILTSGTTGPPKRVPLSYTALDLGGRPPSSRPPGQRGVAINALPLVSIGGALGIVSTVYRERPIALMDRFDVMKWAELVRQYHPRRLGAPPAVIRAILDAKIPPEYFDGAESFVAASAPIDLETTDEFEATYGIPVLRGYGATEFLGAVTSWSLEDYKQNGQRKRGSVGPALPGVELRVVDSETGAELPPGEVGVLEVMPARRPVGAPAGWLRTADVASLDEDGYLWIRGRADDVMIRGGFKVSAGEVADVLREHPQVVDAAVVAIPDPRLGDVPAAAVVLAEGADDAVTGGDLRAWVRDRLPPYKVPVEVVMVDELPRNAMQKVALSQVKALFRR